MGIPDDISVVVCDDVRGFTSITEDFEEKGRIACDRLMERIANPGLEPKRIIMPKILNIGNSTRKLASAK
jgi:DNA-binding LacI/PurR family transcriptional regulator